ncbi:MAG: FmdB family zinc ribbon protein [Pirellulaceae bacterium]
MPTYDYQCGACQHEFEAFHAMSAPVMRKCPECGALKLKRLIGAGAAVVFKGSGFYQTDYRSESYKKRAAEDASASSSTKSDAKTDAKSDKSSGSKSTEKSSGTSQET